MGTESVLLACLSMSLQAPTFIVGAFVFFFFCSRVVLWHSAYHNLPLMLYTQGFLTDELV